jgi:hypothetical protein
MVLKAFAEKLVGVGVDAPEVFDLVKLQLRHVVASVSSAESVGAFWHGRMTRPNA